MSALTEMRRVFFAAQRDAARSAIVSACYSVCEAIGDMAVAKTDEEHEAAKARLGHAHEAMLIASDVEKRCAAELERLGT